MSSFPLLYDLMDRIRDGLNQPIETVGQKTFFLRELVGESRAATRWLISECAEMHVGLNVKKTTIAVAAGAGVVVLPPDLVNIETVYLADSAGKYINDLRTLSWREFERKVGYIWMPSDERLQLSPAANDAMTVGLVYRALPPPVAHGRVVAAGLNTLQIQPYELTTNDVYIGLDVTAIDPVNQLMETKAATDYDGASRTLTFANNWSTIVPSPGTSCWYTSGPDLPSLAEDPFVSLVKSRLAKKLRSSEWEKNQVDERELVRHLKALLRRSDTNQPKRARHNPVRQWPTVFGFPGDWGTNP